MTPKGNAVVFLLPTILASSITVFFKKILGVTMTDNWLLHVAIVSTPQTAPGIWTIINTTLFCYSTLLLIILGFRDEGDIEYDLFVTQWYLTYDIVICFIWLLETSLTMIDTWIVVPKKQQQQLLSSSSSSSYNESSSSTNKWSWFLIILWIVALYMLIDSIVRVTNKIVGDDYPTTDMLLDVGINFISYGYILIVHNIQRRCSKIDASNNDIIDNDTTNNNDSNHYNAITTTTTTTTTTAATTYNRTLSPSYQLS